MSDLRRHMKEDLLPEVVRHKQRVFFGVLILSLTIIATIIIMTGQEEKVLDDVHKEHTGDHYSDIGSLSDLVKAEDRWLIKAERELAELKKQLADRADAETMLQEKVEGLTNKVTNYDNMSIDAVTAEVARIREELDELRKSRTSDATPGIVDFEYPTEMRKIFTHAISLESDRNLRLQDTQNYIPAGSYAPATIILGVDASVGLKAQSEPRPVEFRVTGNAKSAASGDVVQEVDIKGCTITGAASGDLSSERVFVQLLKMTCAQKDHKVTEAEVRGHVASLGKTGIRGAVVSREGDFLLKSFIAGIASSAGSGLAQKFSAPISLPTGLGAKQPEVSDILGSGLGGGISNTSTRLSDYLIQRAEQYQPVISVPAGINVEVVFQEGVYLDGRSGEK